MNTTAAIILTGAELIKSSSAEVARQNRDKLLALAKDCRPVVDLETQTEATDALRALREFSKFIEGSREEAKAPVLRIGREIDALAYDLKANVDTEAKRLSQLLGAYDTEQKRIALIKQQEAAAEERRIRIEAMRAEQEEKERLAKIEREREAALLAKQREIQEAADAKVLQARTDAGRERAAKEAKEQAERLEAEAAREEHEAALRAEREAAEREAQAARDAAAVREAAIAAAPVKQAGTATSTKPKFEVTDIVALYEAAPYLVRLEPNNAAIMSAIRGMRDGQKLPGVKHWFESTTITR